MGPLSGEKRSILTQGHLTFFFSKVITALMMDTIVQKAHSLWRIIYFQREIKLEKVDAPLLLPC